MAGCFYEEGDFIFEDDAKTTILDYIGSGSSVTIPYSVTRIGASAFASCIGLTTVAIPNSVINIGKNVFYGCSSLTSITIPNSVTFIGDGAFNNCSGLMNVDISNSLSLIRSNTFAGCSSLTSVIIPNSVDTIGASAFAECNSLTTVTIGKSVNFIGEGAFNNCSSLTSITSYSVFPPDLGEDAFMGVDKNIPLKVPAESVPSYADAYGWMDFTNIIGIPIQGIAEVEGSLIRCMGDKIIISGAVGQTISIFDITGRVVVREKVMEGKQYTMPQAGVFMVKVGNSPAEKVVVAK